MYLLVFVLVAKEKLYPINQLKHKSKFKITLRKFKATQKTKHDGHFFFFVKILKYYVSYHFSRGVRNGCNLNSTFSTI